jgi:hypothetical protein
MSEKGNLGPSERLVHDWWVYKQQRCRGLAMSIFLLVSKMSYKKFFIDVKINGYAQRMKVDSGCHDTIINKSVWRDMDEPELINVKTTRKSALGKDIPLKGKLFAQVEIGGKVYALPILVSDDDLTRSLMGRRWIPELNSIDWNKLFEDETLVIRPSFPNNRLVRANAMKYRSIPIELDVVLLDTKVKMIFDTGATASIIGLGTWELLGKPKLDSTTRQISDTSNSRLDLKGECSVSVKFNDRQFELTLLVSNSYEMKNILGTNSFPLFAFDFNAIFDKIQFPAPTAMVIDVLPKIKDFKAISFDTDTSSCEVTDDTKVRSKTTNQITQVTHLPNKATKRQNSSQSVPQSMKKISSARVYQTLKVN